MIIHGRYKGLADRQCVITTRKWQIRHPHNPWNDIIENNDIIPLYQWQLLVQKERKVHQWQEELNNTNILGNTLDDKLTFYLVDPCENLTSKLCKCACVLFTCRVHLSVWIAFWIISLSDPIATSEGISISRHVSENGGEVNHMSN